MLRQTRSMLCSFGVVGLVVLPLVAALTIVVRQGVGLSVWFGAALLLVSVPVVVVGKVVKVSSVYSRRRRPKLRFLDLLVEYSFVGAGSLRGWSSSNPAVSLLHLRGSEAPFVAAVAAAARTTQPVPSIKTAPVSPGSFSEYTVARGDTFWSLAERFLGAGARWSELHGLNVGRAVAPGVVLGVDDSLVPGWKIAVPVVGQKV